MAFSNYMISNEFTTNGAQNLTTTNKSVSGVAALSTTQARRGQIYDITMGARDAPAATDCSILYQALRTTTTGTSTVITPNPLDSAGQIMLGQGYANHTAEPTGTLHLLDIALNQRASQRWVAAPGSELVYPATTLNGITVQARSSNYASTVSVTLLVTEL